MTLAVPLYIVGVALLVATALPGRHHEEGRDALAQRRRRDPAERDPEDRDAADAGLVVPAPRRPAARARLRRSRWLLLLRAGRADRQAARPRHRDPGALGRPVRDLLRRAVVEADHPGAAGRRRSAITAVVVSRGAASASPTSSGRCCATTRRTASAPCSTRPPTRSARASTSSRAMIAIGSGGVDRQGLHEGHADAPRVHPRAHHRLHLRRLLRGVRPGRLLHRCCSASSS